MKEHHLPQWERGDSLRSVRDLGTLALDTLVEMISINTDFKDAELPDQEDKPA